MFDVLMVGYRLRGFCCAEAAVFGGFSRITCPEGAAGKVLFPIADEEQHRARASWSRCLVTDARGLPLPTVMICLEQYFALTVPQHVARQR